eukprot:10360874-Prorocentrum_lima.AAC.1
MLIPVGVAIGLMPKSAAARRRRAKARGIAPRGRGRVMHSWSGCSGVFAVDSAIGPPCWLAWSRS